jgi:hypothetical protein
MKGNDTTGRPQEAIYFEERAEAELKLAAEARHQAAVRAHSQLAVYYLDRAQNPDAHAGTSLPDTGGSALTAPEPFHLLGRARSR